MATLEAGLTRDEAFALLQEHNKDPFHIEHGETVEQTMRYSRASSILRTRSSGVSSGCCTISTGKSTTTSPSCTPSTRRRSSRRPAVRPS